MYVTAYNTSSAPVTIDDEGRQISSKDWGTVDTTAEPARDAFDARILIVHEGIPDTAHPAATAARDRTAEVAARYEQFSALDKHVLAGLAKDAGVPDAEEAHKPALTHALASRLDVPVPPPDADPSPEVVQGQPDEQETQGQDQPAEQKGQSEPETKRSTRHRAGRE